MGIKAKLLVALLALAVPLCLPASDREDFDRVTDFSVTIRTLSGLSATQGRALSARIVLLDGTVSAMQYINPEQASFAVELELVSGEWVGLEDVKIYRCRVRFEGPEFFPLFPRRAPKNPSPEQVVPNDRLLVAARLVGQTAGQAGEPLWLLRGLHVRPLR
jgi:hypothetical protein